MDSTSPCNPVTVESGELSGLNSSNGTRTFLGIPYAQPPVGDLRWRPPQRPSSWTGVRTAERFGASSLQFPPPSGSLYFGGETDFSEDCLYLNVYTGRDVEAKRPVLVFFHMGAFLFGSASNPMYDGAKFAAEGITVVTVNYRLGRMGFLSHPELSAESRQGASGNYGIMDQIAALEWVQRNITAFGGDPSNVTIGGVSAGGSSVHILRSSPLAKGLFTKAICESGPGVAPTIEGEGHFAQFQSWASAEKAGVEMLDNLGVASVAELRKLPAETIMAAQLARVQGPWKADLWPGTSSLSVFDTTYPIVDGYVLPASPLSVLAFGKMADVPLLAGNTGNEGSGLPYLDSLEEYLKYVKLTLGDLADTALKLHPATVDSDVRAASSRLLRNQVFVWSTWTCACLQAQYLKSPAWYYRFLREPSIPVEAGIVEREHAGAFHGAGTLYAFGNLDSREWNWAEEDKALSRDVTAAWVQFMKTGDPNGDRGTSWPALRPGHGDEADRQILSWTHGGESRTHRPEEDFLEAMALWDEHYGVEVE